MWRCFKIVTMAWAMGRLPSIAMQKTLTYLYVYIFFWCLLELFVVIIAVLKWSTVQGSNIFGWTFYICLFCGCRGIPSTCATDCPSASNAMDWFASDIWVDIHNLLLVVWKLSTINLSVGKDEGKSSGICFFSSWIWLWCWKRLVKVMHDQVF